MSMTLLSSADIFFKISSFKKFFQDHYQCQLVWIQTVCKGYQQTTKVVPSKKRVKNLLVHLLELSIAYMQ